MRSLIRQYNQQIPKYHATVEYILMCYCTSDEAWMNMKIIRLDMWKQVCMYLKTSAFFSLRYRIPYIFRFLYIDSLHWKVMLFNWLFMSINNFIVTEDYISQIEWGDWSVEPIFLYTFSSKLFDAKLSVNLYLVESYAYVNLPKSPFTYK